MLLRNYSAPSFIASSPTPSGTAAMRNTKRGSWFIQELNRALRLHARDKHLADILVQVKIKHLTLTSFSINVPFMECEAVRFLLQINTDPLCLGQWSC